MKEEMRNLVGVRKKSIVTNRDISNSDYITMENVIYTTPALIAIYKEAILNGDSLQYRGKENGEYLPLKCDKDSINNDNFFMEDYMYRIVNDESTMDDTYEPIIKSKRLMGMFNQFMAENLGENLSALELAQKAFVYMDEKNKENR